MSKLSPQGLPAGWVARCRDADFVRWAQRQPTQAGSGEPGPLGSALSEGCVGQDQETQGRGRVTGTQLEREELSCLDYSSGALRSSIGVWVCIPAWAMMTLFQEAFSLWALRLMGCAHFSLLKLRGVLKSVFEWPLSPLFLRLLSHRPRLLSHRLALFLSLAPAFEAATVSTGRSVSSMCNPSLSLAHASLGRSIAGRVLLLKATSHIPHRHLL